MQKFCVTIGLAVVVACLAAIGTSGNSKGLQDADPKPELLSYAATDIEKHETLVGLAGSCPAFARYYLTKCELRDEEVEEAARRLLEGL